MLTGGPRTLPAFPTRGRWSACLAAACLLLCTAGAGQPDTYPGRTWETRQPAQLGMDAERLRQFAGMVGGHGCVVRHGCLAATWGEWQQRADVASAVKPWYAHLLFRAIEDGKVPGLDQVVVEVEPRLLGKDRSITWRHLATQTSCYGVGERPGEAFDYNDWQMALFFDTLLERVYKASHATADQRILHPLLTGPLGCEDDPTFLAFGREDRPGRLAVSPRDFARFGLLYLRHGSWRGRQLLSRGFTRLAVSDPLPNSLPRTAGQAAPMLPGQRTLGSHAVPDNQGDHLGSYSWLWWVNGVDRKGKRNWPAAPLDTYAALGHGGEDGMAVIPSLDLVVSWNRSKLPDGAMADQAMRLLVGAVLDADPMAGQVVVDRTDPSWLARRGGGPFFMCGPGDPEGFLYRAARNADGTRAGDQVALIHQVAAAGANCMYLVAIRSHGGDGDATQNPFLDGDPARGLNPRLLDQWEEWFIEMDRLGIAIFLVIYDDSARVWDTGDAVGPAERQLVQALVSRFGHHRHLIWCIAEEYEEALSAERVRRLAAVIRQADQHAHPIAVHKHSGLDFTEFRRDRNIDQLAVQYNVGTAGKLHAGLLECRRLDGARHNLNLAEAADFGSGAQARHKLWACALAGANVMVLGMDIAGTPPGDLADCGRVVRFMESVDPAGLAPHDELATGATEYVLAAPPGRYVLYSSGVTGSLGLKGVRAGRYELSWFDCATGRRVVEVRRQAAGSCTLAKPAALGHEVALYMRLEG